FQVCALSRRVISDEVVQTIGSTSDRATRAEVRADFHSEVRDREPQSLAHEACVLPKLKQRDWRICNAIVTLRHLPSPLPRRHDWRMAEVVAAPPIVAPLAVRRWRADDFIKAFFGSNALIAIVVLGLITIFLFREGFGFFGQNLRNIRLYRHAGLEYVDIIRDAANAHAALSRGLNLTRKSAQAR